MWAVHTMDYHSAKKRSEAPIHATTKTAKTSAQKPDTRPHIMTPSKYSEKANLGK